jgi:hypothetical protein
MLNRKRSLRHVEAGEISTTTGKEDIPGPNDRGTKTTTSRHPGGDPANGERNRGKRLDLLPSWWEGSFWGESAL